MLHDLKNLNCPQPNSHSLLTTEATLHSQNNSNMICHTVKKRHFPFWLIWTIWTKSNLAKLMDLFCLSSFNTHDSQLFVQLFALVLRAYFWGEERAVVACVRFLLLVPPGHDKISGNCNKSVTTHSYAASGASSITGRHAWSHHNMKINKTWRRKLCPLQ